MVLVCLSHHLKVVVSAFINTGAWGSTVFHPFPTMSCTWTGITMDSFVFIWPRGRAQGPAPRFPFHGRCEQSFPARRPDAHCIRTVRGKHDASLRTRNELRELKENGLDSHFTIGAGNLFERYALMPIASGRFVGSVTLPYERATSYAS